MTQGEVLNVFSEAILVALKLASPLLIVSIAIGLIVAIFQAATQIHEQTLTFVPKILAISILLLASASWMMGLFNDFVMKLFDIMARL